MLTSRRTRSLGFKDALPSQPFFLFFLFLLDRQKKSEVTFTTFEATLQSVLQSKPELFACLSLPSVIFLYTAPDRLGAFRLNKSPGLFARWRECIHTKTSSMCGRALSGSGLFLSPKARLYLGRLVFFFFSPPSGFEGRAQLIGERPTTRNMLPPCLATDMQITICGGTQTDEDISALGLS